jgi:PTS system fructose-specific IIA component
MITNESLIELQLKSKNKEEIIRSLARKAGEVGRVNNVAGYIEAVFAQEELFYTVIGYGVAMPYGKSIYVENPFIAFARSDEPFRWDNRVDLEANLIFLIGVPEGQNNDLAFELISHMSGGVTNASYREGLLKAKDAAKVVAVFKKMGL